MSSFTNPDNNVAELGLRGGERVAVFGSGAGGHSFAALRALKGRGGVVAFDVRGQLLEKIKNDAVRMRITGLTTKCADYQRVGGTNMGASSFDAVVIPNTLFAVEHKLDMLKEAHRILRLGGRVLVIDWRESYGGIGPQPEHVVSLDRATELLKQAGFTVERTFSAGAQHYGLIAQKK